MEETGANTETDKQFIRLGHPRLGVYVGKEMVDRLTNLIAIFENPALDFSREWLVRFVRFVRFVRRWRERKMADYLDIARRTLQDLRAKGLYPPPAPAPDPEAALRLVRKGQAVCLASDLLGERIWIVADQEDADVLQTQEPGAACYELAEVAILAALQDPEIVREVHHFKRAFPRGTISGSGGRRKV